MHTALALLLLFQADSPDADLIQRFKALAASAQDQVLQAIAKASADAADARLVAIGKVALARAGLPQEAPSRVHDPKTYATGAAPERTRIQPGNPRWPAARRKYPELAVLNDLRVAVRYDLADGRCVCCARPLLPEEILANALLGYPRDADLALGGALRALDSDASRRPLARYFEHSFANLYAECFVGITLYEVWCAGRELDIPDVEAVAFAREILKDHSYISPIPKGDRRTALYRRIAGAFGSFREYRSTREAAAATFLCAEPDMHPTYKPLADRFHYLFARHGEDPTKVARVLDGFPSRSAFLAAIDQEMNQSGGEAFAVVRRRKAAWADSAQRIRAAALAALAAAGIR